MFKKINLAVIAVITFLATWCFAQVADLPPQDFFAEMLEVIHKFGGLGTMAKISAVIVLLVSSMKVSFVRQLFWDKLGAAKPWLAPFLGLIAGILDLGGAGGEISLASVLVYVSAGAGAILLHELLDSVKAAPGVGGIWLTIINLIESVLGKKEIK